MNCSIKTKDFRFTGKGKLHLGKLDTNIEDVYKDKAAYKEHIAEFQKEINELQRMMYAHNRYSMLLIFQAMDAAGKDGTIRAVMAGVNVHGISVHAFKQPSANELEQDFLWRTNLRLPQRGCIGIFNRSYYEEVLVVRVHPEILTSNQRLPAEHRHPLDEVWKGRFQSIRDFEAHLTRNGTKVVKFFLHLGRDEQRDRFLDRIDEPDKNWKFSQADVAGRAHWDKYQEAYRDAIEETATKDSPWYIVPADDKKNMRLIVAQCILDELSDLKMSYPEVSPERRAELQKLREDLAND